MIEVAKQARPNVLRVKEYVPGKPVEEVKRELGLSDVLKMASNENPLGVSPLALEAMITELHENTNYYPEPLCHNLLVKLAARHNLAPQNFYVDNGLDGVITLIGMAFIDPGDETVTSQFTFPAYANITNKMNGKCIQAPMTPDYGFDIDGILAAVTPGTKIVWLCNPNNPTGAIFPKEAFEKVLQALPESVLVVSDEAYYEFADDPAYPQSVPSLEKHTNLVILRTFSKIMGLAGLRVGYAIAHPEIIKLLHKVKDPFPVNRIAQAGALAALDDTGFMQRSIRLVQEGRQQLRDAFDAMNIKCYPGQTNFFFVDMERPTQPVFDAMLREGVIIRPLGPQGLPECLRITIGTKEQNERMLQALNRVLN